MGLLKQDKKQKWQSQAVDGAGCLRLSTTKTVSHKCRELTVLLGCVSNARTGRLFSFNGTFREKCVAREKPCNFFKLPSQRVMWVRCSARGVRIQDTQLPAPFELYKAS